jgi:hypothetical protein
MRWLAAACVSSVCFCTAAFGTFVPLRDDDGTIQYLYAWPGDATFAVSSAIAIAFLAALFFIVVRLARQHDAEEGARAQTGRWLAPATLPALVAVGLAPAVPGASHTLIPLAYYFYDLRWWWFTLSALAVLARIDPLVGGPIRRRLAAVFSTPSARRRVLIDFVIFATVVTWAIATTPHLRFSGGLHGDEPKYIRYCELWYQGGGFDISAKKMLADLPPASGPAVHLIPGLLLRSLVTDARSLAADLTTFVGNPRGFRWNRARGEEGFVSGIKGGVYQIYQPGVSLFLFPGYFLDRFFGNGTAGYQGEFPASLVMTNAMMLAMYGLAAVFLFRLLVRALGSQPLAALTAVVAAATQPTTAFAFQFYPELPALLMILIASRYILFVADEAGTGSAVAAGAAAAFLAWLHPRFLLVSAILALWGLARSRGRNRVSFAAASGLIYLTVLAFNYHVTGSLLPTSLWDAARPMEALDSRGLPINLLGYVLDRMYGLSPHAPFLLAALPGLVVLARSSPMRAVFVAVVCLALAGPAAGHTLSAAGGTPGRLVVAVVPLLAWPAVVALREFWNARTVRAAALLMIVLSLDAALAYNLKHEKPLGAMHADGLSGWRPNLAFPVVRGEGWNSPGNLALLAAMIGALTIVTIGAARRRLPNSPASDDAPWSMTAAEMGGVLAGVVVSIAATSANGTWFRDEYLLGRTTSREIAAASLLSLDRCRLCFTSRDASITWPELGPNPASGIDAHIVARGRDVESHISIASEGGWTGFGKMRVDFGDQSGTPWTPVVGQWNVVHTYAQPGEYIITMTLQLRDGTFRVNRSSVKTQ